VSLTALSRVDTRPFFRPVSSALVALLNELPTPGWEIATVAGSWTVRDVVAHLTDLTLRRLSFHRDGMTPPPPPHAIRSAQDFVTFINTLNAQWVVAARRFSPRVLTDLFARASSEAADWFEGLPLEAPALFSVSWAGESTSEGWFDVGREFTELWHHQQQIRMAIGAPVLDDPRYLRAVIEIALRGLRHAYRDVEAAVGDTIALEISGASGGRWTVRRDEGRWTVLEGETPGPRTHVRMSDDTTWKLLFNALNRNDVQRTIHIQGDQSLAVPLLRARSVIV
jgi:uncharacterized protein (TIGR03083 family)